MVFPSCSTVRIFYMKKMIQKLLMYIDVYQWFKPTVRKMNTYKVNSNGADVAIQIGIILVWKGKNIITKYPSEKFIIVWNTDQKLFTSKSITLVY